MPADVPGLALSHPRPQRLRHDDLSMSAPRSGIMFVGDTAARLTTTQERASMGKRRSTFVH